MTRCLVSLVLSHLLALSTAWSPAVASPRHASRRHARARVVADAALADRAHELYRTLLIDGPAGTSDGHPLRSPASRDCSRLLPP